MGDQTTNGEKNFLVEYTTIAHRPSHFLTLSAPTPDEAIAFFRHYHPLLNPTRLWMEITDTKGETDTKDTKET